MPDFLSPSERSKRMSLIRSKNTKPEKAMASLLREMKLSFRRHVRLPGSPDFLLRGRGVIVFVDGVFWHGQRFDEICHKLSPFWRLKIKTNMRRDAKVNAKLRNMGYSVLRFWETDVQHRPYVVVGAIRRKVSLKIDLQQANQNRCQTTTMI
jgi:DNA mismatch endonuclease (patch repair protein)